jgi:hypothetical protein
VFVRPAHRLVIPKLEFYITNVCNLTCKGCNRFNDLNFRGWQHWNDYADIIKRWSQYIDVKKIVVMGGEPLLNPSVKDWIRGLYSAWNYTVQVLTNGTTIDKVPGLYDAMFMGKQNIGWIGVSLHDRTQRQEIYSKIRKFFGKDVIEIDDPEKTKCGGCKSFVDPDCETFFVEVWDQYQFVPNALRRTPQGTLTLHQSDPTQAFNACGFARHKNYHFIRGKIYRCGPVALFPELDDQFGLDLDESDKRLLRDYKPLSVDEFHQRGQDFFDHIDDQLAQCKFCPTDINRHELVFQKNK